MAQTEETDWPATKSSILTDNPYRPKLLAQQEPPSLVRPELDKLLRMAEDLQEKGDYYDLRRTSFQMIVTAIMGFTSLAFLYAMNSYSMGSAPLAVAAYTMATGTIIAFSVLAKTVIYRMNRQEKRDRKALFSIVDMLREIEPIIAEKEELSALERAEIRIRLARLDIGPGGSR